MSSIHRPVVLVTGGSRGIGLALARGFAARDHDVFLVARDRERLRAAAAAITEEFAVFTDYASHDLAQPKAAESILTAIADAGCYVDILVNCAGVAVSGGFLANDSVQARTTRNLNVEAATELMYGCLPGMVERRRGGVLNVASLAGMVPTPYLAVYGATKSYMIALSRAVATEVAGQGVTVSVVIPGPVDTEFFARNAEFSERPAPLPGLSTEIVARTAIEGFIARQTVITPGVLGSICRLGIKLLPYPLLAPLVGHLMRYSSAPARTAQ